MKKMLALIAVLSLSLGCATMLDLSKSVCNAVLDGSKAGKLCDQIDKLAADEVEEEVVE